MFHAYQTVSNKRELIYHTNGMMTITEKLAIICLDTNDDKKERKNVISHLKESDKEIITILEDQVNHFVGNMLQVLGENSTRYVVMSETAYKSLIPSQINQIEKPYSIPLKRPA